MEERSFYVPIAEELGRRAARATIGQTAPASDGLRKHLLNVLGRDLGEEGAFVAPPVFEALFPWELHDKPISELPILHPRLVSAMDKPRNGLDPFPRDRVPYKHQVDSWRTLLQDDVRSVIVSTGTSSGKTECFLVPILNDLVSEVDRTDKELTGVRALFLYPLNALINSQRDRMRAWMGAKELSGRVRFCLYNGATPNKVKQYRRVESAPEVIDREHLRSNPPPILVTNSTMLEYMLVRAQDRPILDHSKGKLRWIVLDEAHTYVGSNAAEVSLLLRRVLEAFEVEQDQVRFVATSATIGGEGGSEDLCTYLADLAGVARDQVVHITGRRVAPELPAELAALDEPLPRAGELVGLSPDVLYRRLASVKSLRSVRSQLAEGAKGLVEIAEAFGPADEGVSGQLGEALGVLDAASAARSNGDPVALIPTRAHYFHRTTGGLWACVSSSCPGRSGTDLDHEDWAFGATYLSRRTSCSHCDSLVFEVVLCRGCGTAHLAAEDNGSQIQPALWEFRDSQSADEDDMYEPDDDAGDDEVTVAAVETVLLCEAKSHHGVSIRLDARSGDYPAESGSPAALEIALRPPDGSRFRCGHCDRKDTRRAEAFKPVRMGAPFYLSAAVPTLLEKLPAHKENPGAKPIGGRRLITFSDSRQGTARYAVRAQLEAERNYVRSMVYHSLWEQVSAPDTSEIEKKRGELEAYRIAAKASPSGGHG